MLSIILAVRPEEALVLGRNALLVLGLDALQARTERLASSIVVVGPQEGGPSGAVSLCCARPEPL